MVGFTVRVRVRVRATVRASVRVHSVFRVYFVIYLYYIVTIKHTLIDFDEFVELRLLLYKQSHKLAKV